MSKPLNENEIAARDIYIRHLAARGTLTTVEQTGDGKLLIEIVAPNTFDWASNNLNDAAYETMAKTGLGIDLKISTSWPVTATRS